MPFTATRWKLDALLPSTEPAVVEKALKTFERKVKKVESHRKLLKKTISAKDFNALLKDYEASIVEAYRVYAFAQLRFAADTQDQSAMALLGQIQQRMAQAENRVLFFSLWWKQLDDRNAARLMKSAGDLTYWLEEMRHFKIGRAHV